MTNKKQKVSFFWFRRDLRLFDNRGLSEALEASKQVICLFIFDTDILMKLPDENDARVTFIHQKVQELQKELRAFHSDIIIKQGSPLIIWQQLTNEYEIEKVFTNADYEPYAINRDLQVKRYLNDIEIEFHSIKDQVIWEKGDIVKADLTPYTVFTPYSKKWLAYLYTSLNNNSAFLDWIPFKHDHFLKFQGNDALSLDELGFQQSRILIPSPNYRKIIKSYGITRDYPSQNGTSMLGIHLRFGTISIRQLVKDALKLEDQTFLSELIWREFFMMLLWHFPHSVNKAFKTQYDRIQWRNNEKEFEAWCNGNTGYPLVDAGMRQLRSTGWMHNRIRMIAASFLCKHLLIDWRWGETHFARYLLDYDQSSNIGNWQWAASCGADAVPYFRIFNPSIQQQKFDKDGKYIRKWIPEYIDPFKYPHPIVSHEEARERTIRAYTKAVKSEK